ncbi:Proteophosphoglycan ppg4 [Rhodotorula toruloides ATCC 204091]|uniref:BY PROTMAP: gi/342319288/gb/EGU11237.1/ Proteophosphoglycan ppg4 [Rhodotorula glutinis ATCC 204091] n=1 Tax=Rhodotorula toruloides TaxID=5286 RepID=A0A0K3CCM6_RHOTO|nr:Proteophosphoglycan ppg4 [Rhodotorula toruloides ATCC 204091]
MSRTTVLCEVDKVNERRVDGWRGTLDSDPLTPAGHAQRQLRMAQVSAQDRLIADFPSLDSALVYAILSDFTHPLSAADERAARDILDSLARDADSQDPLDEPDLAASSQAEPSEDDRVQLLRLLDEAAAEFGRPRKVGSRSRDVSELGRRLEGATIEDGASAATRTASNGSSDAQSDEQAARFWPRSEAASLTSDDDGRPLEAGKLVWDVPDDFLEDVEDDPLAFLASVFPHIDLAQLEAKIQEVSKPAAAGGGVAARPADLETLIEDLLSQDLITSLTEVDAEAAAKAAAPADPDGIAEMNRQQKRKVKAAQKASNSYSLTSTPHVSYAAAATAATQPPSMSALASAPSSANAWVSITSQTSLLSTLLHIPAARITSLYYKQSSSLPHTVSVLLSQLSRERPFETLPNNFELRAQLRLIIPPSRANDDVLEMLLSATEGDLSDALDLHHFLRDLESDLGKNLTLISMLSADAPESSVTPLATLSGSSDGFTTVTSLRRSPTLPRASLHPAPDRSHSYNDCAALALEYLEKRNEAFRTAARHFQKDDKIRTDASTSCRAITDPNTIDLHGLTLAHALKIVDEATVSWWANARDSVSITPLRIIVGVGRHSRNNTPILAPAVTKHLDKHGWRWKWDDGPLVAGGIGTAGSTKGAVKVLGVK